MRRMVSLLAIVALAACTEQEDSLITDSEPGPVLATWTASLAGLPVRPTAGGTVTMMVHQSLFTATGSFTGLLPNREYHWKAYFGTCAARLQQVGPNANPPALAFFTTDASGAGSAQGLMAGRLREDSTYNVRVFTASQPTTANDTVVYACGDLAKQ